MRVTVKAGLGFALLWILMKMVFFWTGSLNYNIVPPVLLNMLCLIAAIALGLYLHKRRETEVGNALNDIKNAMTAAIPYVLVVSIFIYLYYNSIHPGYNEHQLSEAYTDIQKLLDSPEGLQQVRNSNPEFEVLTKEEIYNKLKQGPEGFYSPTSTMTLSMLGLLVLGTMNSILIAVIYRKVVFR
jgi:hypothetical protein